VITTSPDAAVLESSGCSDGADELSGEAPGVLDCGDEADGVFGSLFSAQAHKVISKNIIAAASMSLLNFKKSTP